MNYDSRSTWDSGLDAGSIPARSIRERPTKDRIYGHYRHWKIVRFTILDRSKSFQINMIVVKK